MRLHRVVLAVLGAVLLSVACGQGARSSSSESSTSGGTLDPGASGGRTAAGVGGAGAATAGTPSGGAVTAPPPLPCGTAVCAPIAVGSGFAAPCCADAAASICGADVTAVAPTMGCQPLNQPGELDPACPPSVGAMAGGFPLPEFPGCCRVTTGQCGFLVDDLGGALPFAPGCVDATTLVADAVPMACGAGGQPSGAGAAGDDGAGGAASGGASSNP